MRTKSTLLCFTIAICINTFIANAQVNVQDSLALVDLYNSTNGPGWLKHKHWLTSAAVSEWYGITVTSNRVTGISLTSNNLVGTLPSSLGNLVNLLSLLLYENQLSGNIPSELGNLVNLNILDLRFNQLSGSIPPELGNLVNLSYLLLRDNQLSGNIPPELGNFVNLASLELSLNQLSGSIPPELGNLVNLSSLSLENNQLSGSIPPELGNLVYLQNLFLTSNQLSGSIPATLGNLVNLRYLQLEYNQLSGSIPPELGNLVYLTKLSLTYNQLSGSIPSSFGNFENLYYLDLSYNQFSGSIPSSIGNKVRLNYLYLNNNQLSGSIPSSIAFANLVALDLSRNHFTFDGMELIAQTFSFAKYSNQARIPVHLNNNALSVSAGGTLINNTYLWYKKGKAGYTKIAGDSVFHPSESGVYIVRVRNKIATNLNLFSDTITYSAPVPLTAFSANSQSAISNSIFSVYPNPVKDLLYVKTNCNASFSLLDQSGKILFTREIDGTGNIDVSGMPAGLYYLKNNNAGTVRKIIITR